MKKLRSVADVRVAFDEIDANGSGELDQEELTKCLRKLGQCVRDKDVAKLMRSIGGADSVISWLEFIDAVADGTLDEMSFAAALDISNVVQLSEEGAAPKYDSINRV